MLRIYLLGALQIELDSQTVRLPRRKVESLLAYLLLHPEVQSRDTLATLFWGDTSDEKARHSLRTSLATLRQYFGESLLITNREQVQINPEFALWVDLHELLRFGKEADFTQPGTVDSLQKLWRGELLEGLYEDWLTAEREHYRARLIKLFLKVTHLLRSQSEYAQAIRVAQQILQVEPANEAAHQHLMFCYVAAGDRAAALRQYERCEQSLLEDLDASPLAETTALYHWIRQQEGAETSITARITNLPIPLTSFVGRTQQTSELKRMLSPQSSHIHLLTLTGAGGSGKTRLAIQCATDLIDSFNDGVWWVDLAVLNEDDQVARAVAKSLGVSEVSNQSTLQSITSFVADKQLLLVLDNCEHLIDAAAAATDELLRRCPNLRILTTSRESLNVPGEVLWQVPTLSLPEPQQVSLLDVLLHHECIRLFYERAIAVQSSFQLTLANAAAVMEICARLDGIPLAIELAAARVKVLPVEQIAARLNSAIGARFALLNQGNRTVQPRQQTLRAAIDWSYDLLDREERQLFRILSVFRGGFTLEALERILECGMWNVESSIHNSQFIIRNSLDLLSQLVDKSLVVVEPQSGQNRYRMLETLREYALEQFVDPNELQGAQRCHAQFFADWAEQAASHLLGFQQQEWLNLFETEHPNLRAALDFSLNADVVLAPRLALSATRFWGTRGYLGEGREWFQRILQKQPALPTVLLAKALNAAGTLAYRQGDLEQAQALCKQSLELFQQIGDEIGMVDAMENLVLLAIPRGNFQLAEQYLEQSVELSQRSAYDYGTARALLLSGNLAYDRDDIATARDYFLESLALYRVLGDQVNIANLLVNLSSAFTVLGNLDSAYQYELECLNVSRAIGHKGLISTALRSLGLYALSQNEYEQARSYGEESLQLTRSQGDKSNSGFALLLLGKVAYKLRDYPAALNYFRQNLEIMVELNYRWPIYDVLEEIARLLTDTGQHLDQATLFLSAANVIRQEIGNSVNATDQTEYERYLQALRQQSDFTQFWQQGQTTPLAEIVSAVRAISLAEK